MVITATELKSNLGRYLDLADSEDIFISRNGKIAAKLTSPCSSRVQAMESLFGILPSDVTVQDARAAREEAKWGLC